MSLSIEFGRSWETHQYTKNCLFGIQDMLLLTKTIITIPALE